MAHVRIALAQLNSVVGDLRTNSAMALAALQRAEDAGCDLVAFPELMICGYPPEDLLLKPGFVVDAEVALNEVAAATKQCVAIIGNVRYDDELYNAAYICTQGKVVGAYEKRLLPNYAVFDEHRYFRPGTQPLQLWRVAGVDVGVVICEDIWSPTGPMADLAIGGAEIVVSINASPYQAGKKYLRHSLLQTRAADASCALVYVNQVGGQDELVFDGGSMVFSSSGELVAAAPQFVDDLVIVDLELDSAYRKRQIDPRGQGPVVALPVTVVTEASRTSSIDHPPVIVAPLDPVEEIYRALVLGTRDYLRKTSFSDVVIGLSGGIDSSLVACIAVDALGPEHVHGLSMPSRYSSPGSRTDAELLADNLKIDCSTVPIESMHASFLETVGPFEHPLTEENLQSRIRGVVLMARSNDNGWLVLTTGNKSELAVGYSTLYGDSAGGFAVIRDIPKTLVYRLCEYVNEKAGREVIPKAVLTKPPSAELRPDQRDDQSLPPYEVLDPILEAYIEDDKTADELIELGFDEATVRRVVVLVDRAEYKRRQSPLGVRVSPKAFGKDRRMPIANGYT